LSWNRTRMEHFWEHFLKIRRSMKKAREATEQSLPSSSKTKG